MTKINFLSNLNAKYIRIASLSAVMTSVLVLSLFATIPDSAAVHSGAPPGKPIDLVWHNDQLWNSVVIGTLHGNPNPATLDVFYVFSDQNPVAGAGPGDRDYNGGRWLPTMVSCTSDPCGPFTDGDDVEAALENGTLQVDGTGTPFLCPLINPNDEA